MADLFTLFLGNRVNERFGPLQSNLTSLANSTLLLIVPPFIVTDETIIANSVKEHSILDYFNTFF